MLQGNINGPIMFIMNIIDMNDMIKSSNLIKLTFYADKTSLNYSTKIVKENIPIFNNELLKVSVWLGTIHLSLNVEKQALSFFHIPRAVLNPSSPSVLIGNNVI